MSARRSPQLGGVLAAAGAYGIWGLFPGYFGLMHDAGGLEILAHRIVWTAVLMGTVIALTGAWRQLTAMSARTWALVVSASAVIAANWGLYIWAVEQGRVVEAALGYFINPLVSVLLGLVVFREKLSRTTVFALILATVAVAVITVDYGRPPYVALTLALTFAGYGLIKKVVPLDPSASLAAEAAVASPLALGYLVVLAAQGSLAFVAHGPGLTALLLAAGPVTAAPLLLFGIGAHRVPLSTMGMLQYITPVLQMVWGVLVVHETMPPARWIGFGIIWLALAVFVVGTIARSRTNNHSRTTGTSADTPVAE